MAQHIMLDIETLDVVSSAVVASIGAVAFDPTTDTIADTFYHQLELEPQIATGRTISASTLLWWLNQSEVARNSTFLSGNELHPVDVISLLHEFVARHSGSACSIWGNGSDFDNVIVTSLCASFNRKAPWGYGSARCYRTIRKLFPTPEVVRIGTHHNALDDATHQAKHLQAIVSKHGIKTL